VIIALCGATPDLVRGAVVGISVTGRSRARG
jgi:hypothetical protein